MKTYKLGNKIKCIIRSITSGCIGEQQMDYPNQPYTVLHDVEARLDFKDFGKEAKDSFIKLAYHADNLQQVVLSNVELNDKILNLIFAKNQQGQCVTVQNCMSVNNKIYITTSAEKIYQVFIYNIDGQLEKFYESLDNFIITTERNNEDYLVFFAYFGEKSYKLTYAQDMYLTLDLILTGNKDDELNTSYIHINRCSVQIDKNMYFNRGLNTVDLIFKVINDGESYITLNS